jgi:ribonucleoside-triphosphate reductase (formate)
LITKRDGRQVQYDRSKIENAVKAACLDVGLSEDESVDVGILVADGFEGCGYDKKDMSVEEVQDIVETLLMEESYTEVAKAYILYRYEHTLRRQQRTDKEILSMVGNQNDYWATENSNKNSKWVTTQRDYMAGIVSTDIARNFIFPKECIDAHDKGIIHIHDMDYMAQNTLSNCFSADTEFVTSEGVKSFNDFYDGSPVVVRDKDGRWRSAIVHNFGKQILYTVTLQSGRSIQKIRCTRNHRWILEDGSVTENLQVGDSLLALPNVADNFKINTVEDAKAFCLGFVLGDGSDINSNRGVRVRLCGHKKDDYSPYFEQAGYQFSSVKGTEDIIATSKDCVSKQLFLDSSMWRVMSTAQKIALFNGYYAADGCTSSNAIHTCDKRNLALILEIAPVAGYYISSVRHDIHDTPYRENASLYVVHFRKKNNLNNLWKVKEIKKSCNNNHASNVWCVVEPATHTFTLASGIVTGNCSLINLEDMLQNGTVVNGVQIDKPHRLSTAMTIATQIIAAVASSQYGGCTITLTHLAPFVRLSYLQFYNKYIGWGFSESEAEKYARVDLKKEVADAVQTLNYQLNSLTTTNGQAPFISVTMYLGETEEYKPELAMLIEEVLRQRIKGMKNRVGVYVTVAFPKLLYVLEEDNIHHDSKYWYLTQLAAKCTAKRMVPDYISEKKMKEIKNGDCFPCMGCRSFLTPDRFTETLGNIANAGNYDGKPKYYGRFNCGVTTINLVDAALSAKKICEDEGLDITQENLEKYFWPLMEDRTELCHKVQQIRAERISKTKAEVAPILWCDGAFARLDKDDTLDKLVHNGYATSSIGFAGLYECVKVITGESHTQKVGKEFGLRVMRFLNAQCDKWKAEENIDYSIYGSPIESTTYTFQKGLHKRFGVVEGITDRDYITNSYHVPVFEKISIFDKFALESEFQNLAPGGAISYGEGCDLTNNLEVVEAVIQYIYDTIMYAELNFKSDYCQECGYDGEIELKYDEKAHKHYYQCPNCGNLDTDKMNIARRVCGYISTTVPNEGRLGDIADRYIHIDDHELGE